MHCDVTTLTVRPGATPKALPQLDQWLRGTRLGGTLLACWLTEIGALNQILLIREYESEPAIAADRDAIVRSGNPYGVADMITPPRRAIRMYRSRSCHRCKRAPLDRSSRCAPTS